MRVLAELEYTTIRQIGVGQGANSTVYLADEHQLGGVVVVKEMEKTRFSDPTAYFAEAQVMFSTNTTNVVPIQYACQTHDKICLVMPFLPGGSLADRITTTPLPPCDAVRTFLAVLDGLSEIHLKGYLHLDLKPSNILFDADGRPLIADFGQSRPIPPGGFAIQPRLYCLSVPPEIVSTGIAACTIQTDIYQAGLSLYRAVNGDRFVDRQKPVSWDDIKTGRFPDRRKFQPHVPKGLRTVIRKALEVDPANRYRSAMEFADALGQIDCPYNWVMLERADQSVEWRVRRPGQPEMVVELMPVGSRWNVQVHTGALEITG
jgi:serine/threonine protein kinase